MKIAPLAAVAALVAASPAAAWGDRGHRAIADIAWTELTPAAREHAAQLLAHAPELATPACPVGSFEDGATWADCIRSRYHDRYSSTSSWHYVDVSICRPFALPGDPDARFIVARFERELATLADRRNPAAARLEALLWVEHLVGDLHQPLHVGDDGDRGGNEVDVYPQSGRYSVNLHSEWDRVLVDDALHGAPGGVAGLAADARARQRSLRIGSAAGWARESWDLARGTAYTAAAVSAECGTGAPPVDVGPAYRATAVPIVDQQLEHAGLRLAAVLNAALR